jgi:hypothetical protein
VVKAMTQRKKTTASKLLSQTSWIEFVVLVLAFIGLWQVLTGGVAALTMLM